MRLQCYEFLDVVCEHLLVARDDGQTRLQGALDDGVGGLGVVDELDDEVYFRVVEYVVGLVREVGLDGARLADVAYADAFYLDVFGAYALQNVIETAAHGSETEESDVEFFTVHGVVCFPICGS